MSLIAELRRRNVFRVAAAYLVVGWLLTEVMTAILPRLGASEWVSDAVVLVFAFGFIPTVILSWVYELTPEGIKREQEIDRDASITDKTARKLDYITVGGVIILVVILGLFSARQGEDVSSLGLLSVSDASVAVLPFVNMSNDVDNEYFSDGLTETLLHMLTQIPDLKVAARTSSFAFKGQNRPIGEIASELQVAHILEGSVQRVGDRVRITAQLIRASDGFHVWSNSYDRTIDDIFGIQDEIAEKVGGALSASLLGTPSGRQLAGIGTTSPDAYDLYLQALKERATYSYGGLQAAEDLLKGALTIDPDFLDAKTQLASNYMHQIETGLMGTDEAVPEIIALLDQVLAQRPDDASARAIRIAANATTTLEKAGPDGMFKAVEELEAIVANAPEQLEPKTMLIRFYQGLKQPEKSLPLMLDALDRDPFNPRIHYELGNQYALLDRADDARKSLERSLELEPAQPNALANLAALSLQAGEGLDYLQLFLKAIEVDPVDHELPGIIAHFLYQLELIDEGDDFRDRVMAIAPTSEIAYHIELMRAVNSGDQEASLASARRAIEDDVGDRRHAFGGAVVHLLRSAARDDSVGEALAYLEEKAPGIFDIGATSVPLKYRTSQFAAFDAWYVVESQEEINARIERMLEIARTYGFDPETDRNFRAGLFALQGRTEEAIGAALADVFSEPVTTNLGWERTFSLGQYADIVKDPQIQEAMQRWEQEEDALREQIRTYLADLQTLQAST